VKSEKLDLTEDIGLEALKRSMRVIVQCDLRLLSVLVAKAALSAYRRDNTESPSERRAVPRTRAQESAEEHPKSDARALRRERARSVDSVPAAYLFLHLNFIIVFRRYGV